MYDVSVIENPFPARFFIGCDAYYKTGADTYIRLILQNQTSVCGHRHMCPVNQIYVWFWNIINKHLLFFIQTE
jgi:hypothetical protein